MSVLIDSVLKNSIAAKKHIQSGDTLVCINDNPINDVLDYEFYAAEIALTLKIQNANKQEKIIKIKKDEYEDLGLQFSTYLMSAQRSCKNNCIFCFIDQMPKGMRESLYFKDDDDRLSFIFGNYITLTNISDDEIDRIIKMHISPVNISVHTTNKELRAKMMNNRFAGEKLAYLYRLAEAGIKINCQLVLCPDYNDGEELRKSLADLVKLYPSVQSIACVPVGLTDYREGLEKLTSFSKERAGEVIDIIESFSKEMRKQHDVGLIYPSDEFFIKSQRKIPNEDYYDDFVQLENGVGMLAIQKSEFLYALSDIEESDEVRNITIATGVAAQPFLKQLVDLTVEKWHNLNCRVIAVKNKFFGENITVAGLLTGQDLKAQLENENLGEELLLSSNMLRKEQDIFLDDMTVEELTKALKVKITFCENDGEKLLNAIIGRCDFTK